MISPCIDLGCIQCCKNTKMILSEKDIDRIQSLGFSYNYFININNGWLELKNKDGVCVFHNYKKCIIYENRPEGCALYPLIYDIDDKCAIFDKECPHQSKFIIYKDLKNKIFNLVSRVISERSKRMNYDKD
jgi:Fe-S-cluster containining protein